MEIKEKSSTVSIDVSKCLSCETKACVAACTFHGNKAITIDVPVAGLPEYLAKRGLA